MQVPREARPHEGAAEDVSIPIRREAKSTRARELRFLEQVLIGLARRRLRIEP
jgi:hypothetical protein